MEDFGFDGPMGDETPIDDCDWDWCEDADEYDGQPDEAQEWQDFMGGDEYYDHSEAQWDGDF
tara:strand:+ start:338 stop:523 length:186 start_codon:yes stop_codon:yes gene_type:complete